MFYFSRCSALVQSYHLSISQLAAPSAGLGGNPVTVLTFGKKRGNVVKTLEKLGIFR